MLFGKYGGAPEEILGSFFFVRSIKEIAIQMLKGSTLMEMIHGCADVEVNRILQSYQCSLEAQGYAAEEIPIEVYLMNTVDTCDSLGSSWGFSLLANQWSGAHFKHPGFHPYWEHIIEHQNWYEMLCLVGDDGSGRIVFISKEIEDAELLEMCQLYRQMA